MKKIMMMMTTMRTRWRWLSFNMSGNWVSGMLRDLAKVTKVLKPWAQFPSSKLSLVSRLLGLNEGIRAGCSYGKGPVSTHKNFHDRTFQKWVQRERVPDPPISIFVLVKTQVCLTSLTSKHLPGRAHCTVWVSNGIANSPCNSPCTLMMSWLEESHRPFQTLTYFSLSMLLRGQRRLRSLCFTDEKTKT